MNTKELLLIAGLLSTGSIPACTPADNEPIPASTPTSRANNTPERTPAAEPYVQSARADFRDVSTNMTPQEKQLVKETLTPILNEMQSSASLSLQQAASEYAELIADPRRRVVILDAVMPNPGDIRVNGSYDKPYTQIALSGKSFREGEFSKADWVVHLYRLMLFHRQANQSEGNAFEKMDELKTIRSNQAQIWQEVWGAIESDYGNKVSSSDLKNSYRKYLASR